MNRDRHLATVALVRAGKPHEFALFPGQYHSYDAVHDAYFWQKATAFSAAHLH
jgi:dipeptidyl-peptidase-4